MLEILQYVTSGFGAFVGSLIFGAGIITSIGYAGYMILMGWRGKDI